MTHKEKFDSLPDEQFFKAISLAKSYRQLHRILNIPDNERLRQAIKNRVILSGASTKHFKPYGTCHNTFTKEKFKEIVKESHSINECLRKLGLSVAGGNAGTYKRYIKEMNIDCSHFSGRAWNKDLKGKTFLEKLTTDSHCSTGHIKKKLIQFNMLKSNCYICGLKDTWNEKPIVLHLDHINGEHTDNRLENLRLLCPNCHSQTDTYCSKNKTKKRYLKNIDPVL